MFTIREARLNLESYTSFACFTNIYQLFFSVFRIRIRIQVFKNDYYDYDDYDYDDYDYDEYDYDDYNFNYDYDYG